MTPSIDDDRSLVRRITQARDESAFTSLYERHTQRLFRLALRLTHGDTDAAEDVVHDAWIASVPRLASFEWRSQLSTWLAGFVVNAARANRRAGLHEGGPVEAEGEQDSELSGTFDRIDLERALESLPTGYREVLVLHDLEGYTHDEIAEITGIAQGTSKSQLSRARRAMRRALRGTVVDGGHDHG